MIHGVTSIRDAVAGMTAHFLVQSRVVIIGYFEMPHY